MTTQWYVCEKCLTPALITTGLPKDRPTETFCDGCYEIRLAYPLYIAQPCIAHDIRSAAAWAGIEVD